MNIFLLGYMYSGKSTVGRQLARAMGYRFVDLDVLFEERYHTTIPLFFRKYDEAAFRRLEQMLLHETEGFENTIISTGGGTPCFADNMQWINSHGLSVWLDVSFPTLESRAAVSRKHRPLAISRQHYESRQQFYRQAQIRFPADSPDIPALISLLRVPQHP